MPSSVVTASRGGLGPSHSISLTFSLSPSYKDLGDDLGPTCKCGGISHLQVLNLLCQVHCPARGGSHRLRDLAAGVFWSPLSLPWGGVYGCGGTGTGAVRGDIFASCSAVRWYIILDSLISCFWILRNNSVFRTNMLGDCGPEGTSNFLAARLGRSPQRGRGLGHSVHLLCGHGSPDYFD